MDQSVIVTLLTITVVLLSVVIVALLITVTVVLVKLNKLIRSIHAVTDNLKTATTWLSPTKLFGEAARAFRNR